MLYSDRDLDENIERFDPVEDVSVLTLMGLLIFMM
jgi:hypothetical protein